jgi:hypothetical protein
VRHVCRDEQKRKELGAVKALSAAKEFVMTQSKLQGPARSKQLFGMSIGTASTGGRTDADIANVVPDDWKEGKEYYRSAQLTFTKGEIAVAFRSDGSRRFGKIIQVRQGAATHELVQATGSLEGLNQVLTCGAVRCGAIPHIHRTNAIRIGTENPARVPTHVFLMHIFSAASD